MNKTIATIFIAASCASNANCYCQYTDSVAIQQKDTIPYRINWQTPPAKNIFPYKSFIVPATLVVYGVTTLHSKHLWNVNEQVKDELYTDRSSPKKIHADNYLLFAPAVSVYALNLAGIKGKKQFSRSQYVIGNVGTYYGLYRVCCKKICRRNTTRWVR